MLFEAAHAIILPVMLLTATVSALFVLGGWNRRRALLQRRRETPKPERFSPARAPFASGTIDVATEMRGVLQELEPLAAANFVELDLAVQPGLTLRADPRAFREILRDVGECAIKQTPCGRVLLGAARSGSRVQLTVCDDGVTADRGARLGQLRSAERLAALQGASLSVDALPGQGTTVFLRMPGPAGLRQAMEIERPSASDVWSPARAKRQADSAVR